VDDWRRAPGEGRYAQRELERRFLVTGKPPVAESRRLVEDRYLDGTTLRLRRVTVSDERVWKLTQKVRADAKDPASVAITNIYLTGDEYALLAQLPASVLTKRRSICVVDGARFAIDEFDGHLAGLRLAEVEIDDLEHELPQSPWLGRDVTHDDCFSGGRLARLPSGHLDQLLAGTT
jgi:CYTH domain-containing protein